VMGCVLVNPDETKQSKAYCKVLGATPILTSALWLGDQFLQDSER
jgi:hypothetical protein